MLPVGCYPRVTPEAEKWSGGWSRTHDDVTGALHRLFEFLSLRLLVGVKDIRLLCGQPRQHLVEPGLVRPVSQHEHLLGVDALADQQVVKMHPDRLRDLLAGGRLG